MTPGPARYRPEDDPYYQSGPPPKADTANSGIVVSDDTRRETRLPPGQVRTKKWPVLQAGRIPEISPDRWTFTVTGLVERELQLTMASWSDLPRVQVFADFHCVTCWSRLGNLWEGVSTSYIAQLAGVHREARFVIITGYDDDWTTNIPIGEFLFCDALFAEKHDGRPLAPEHGGPVRLIVPRLYAWKSAKWVRRLEFVASDRPGYWEGLGYHDRGDPWNEERFRQENERK